MWVVRKSTMRRNKISQNSITISLICAMFISWCEGRRTYNNGIIITLRRNLCHQTIKHRATPIIDIDWYDDHAWSASRTSRRTAGPWGDSNGGQSVIGQLYWLHRGWRWIDQWRLSRCLLATVEVSTRSVPWPRQQWFIYIATWCVYRMTSNNTS